MDASPCSTLTIVQQSPSQRRLPWEDADTEAVSLTSGDSSSSPITGPIAAVSSPILEPSLSLIEPGDAQIFDAGLVSDSGDPRYRSADQRGLRPRYLEREPMYRDGSDQMSGASQDTSSEDTDSRSDHSETRCFHELLPGDDILKAQGFFFDSISGLHRCAVCAEVVWGLDLPGDDYYTAGHGYAGHIDDPDDKEIMAYHDYLVATDEGAADVDWADYIAQDSEATSDQAHFDKDEEVWRCSICGWEVESDNCIKGQCVQGHQIDCAALRTYGPAYDCSYDLAANGDPSHENESGDEGEDEYECDSFVTDGTSSFVDGASILLRDDKAREGEGDMEVPVTDPSLDNVQEDLEDAPSESSNSGLAGYLGWSSRS